MYTEVKVSFVAGNGSILTHLGSKELEVAWYSCKYLHNLVVVGVGKVAGEGCKSSFGGVGGKWWDFGLGVDKFGGFGTDCC